MAKVQGWVMLEPGKMELQTFDIPKIEEDGVLLKVDACGICGSDVHAYLGHIRTAPFPMIPGHEFIGTIAEVGKSASSKMAIVGGGPLKEGDRGNKGTLETRGRWCKDNLLHVLIYIKALLRIRHPIQQRSPHPREPTHRDFRIISSL